MARTDVDVRPRPRPEAPKHGTGRVVHVIGIVGRVFVAAGLILLFYTAYLLWGTGVYTAQQQEQAAQELASNPLVGEEQLSNGDIPPARPAEPVALGSPLFTMKIPKLAVETAIVEGVGREELKKGPGHFPDCADVGDGVECVEGAAYPSEEGNVAISGHRTTYGAPFFNLHQLEKGDVIDVVSGRARYRYQVRGQEIVDPVAGYNVVEQHGRSELTLTTCHPRFSAAQRLIIHADYVGSSLVAPPPAAAVGDVPIQPGPQPVVAPDVLILASVALASALGAAGLSKRWRMTAAYTAMAIAGAAGLWVGVFPRILAMMPANY